MKETLDFWGEPLALGDWVVYCCTKVPRLGQIVSISSKRVGVREFNSRRDTRFQPEIDLRTPHNLIRAEGPHLTAYFLKRKWTR